MLQKDRTKETVSKRVLGRGNLIMFIKSFNFCWVLLTEFIRSKSLGTAHTQGSRLHKSVNIRRLRLLGAISEAASTLSIHECVGKQVVIKFC